MSVFAEGSILDKFTARQTKVRVLEGLGVAPGTASFSPGLATGMGIGTAPGPVAGPGVLPKVNCSIQTPASTPGLIADNFFLMSSSERMSTCFNSASTSPQ